MKNDRKWKVTFESLLSNNSLTVKSHLDSLFETDQVVSKEISESLSLLQIKA